MKFKLFFILTLISVCTFAQTKENAQINQDFFWEELQKICGKAFEGKMVAGPENDTTFANKTLIMRALKCKKVQVNIPF